MSGIWRKVLAFFILLSDASLYLHDCDQRSAPTLAKYAQCSGLIGSDFVTIKLLLLTSDPLYSIYRTGEDLRPHVLPLLQRLEWGANLAWNLRGIGLNTQTEYIPYTKYPSQRLPFVLSQIRRLLLHLLRLILVWVPVLQFKLHKTTFLNEPPPPSVLSLALGRFLFAAVILTTCYALIDIAYTVAAIAAVGSGYSKPTVWPPCFGSWSDATTVRRAWGRCWHQWYRTPFVMIGTFIMNDILRVQRGSKASSYGKLYMAFLVSGLMHAAGDYGMYHGKRWFSLTYFSLQAVAITFEDAVIGIADWFAFRTRFPTLSTYLGYLWVVVWFSVTLPTFGEAFLPAITF